MRQGNYNLLAIIPVEHLTSGVEFVMDMNFIHLHELYDDDSLYEKAVIWWTPFWSTIFSKFIQFDASHKFCFGIILISSHLVIVVSVDFGCKMRLWQSGILLKSLMI